MKLLSFFFVFLIFTGSQLQGQGLKLTSLKSRPVSTSEAPTGEIATLFIDTLTLPFFEDFTATLGYPSTLRWCDKQVWINNTFSQGQPNYNVATFDHLDSRGRPYTTLNKRESVYADSLTSFPIKLDKYKTGPSTMANYLPTDSIILSFFFQQKGLGDQPEPEDTLILFFKNNLNLWVRVWSKNGSSGTGFIQVLVPVNKVEFLHNAFQFRFVNFTKATGNLNHWHLDYIRLEKYKNRSGGNDIFDISDIGITKPDYWIFNQYHSLPYSHFKTNPSGITKNQLSLTVKNLNTSPAKTTQTRFGLKVTNQYGTVVFNQPPSASSRNILFNSDSTLPYSKLLLDTFSGKNPHFKINYIIEPQSNDVTPTQYNAEGDNNQLEVNYSFNPWYAYDDGSAEGGFGLDYSFLGNVKGQFALKFENLKMDSLRGVAIYFNRSEEDVSFRSFYIRVWKNISPVGQSDNKDELLYEQFVSKPNYTDSINHFSYIFFDSVLQIPAGTFYMGWRQNQPFILNVGYDNNYRFNGQNVGNPNLYHNLLGSWERSDYEIKGTPMIRPLIGADSDYSFGVNNSYKTKIIFYPNPANNSLFWSEQLNQGIITILDQAGRVCINQQFLSSSIDINNLKPGMYFVILQSINGEKYQTQIIKN